MGSFSFLYAEAILLKIQTSLLVFVSELFCYISYVGTDVLYFIVFEAQVNMLNELPRLEWGHFYMYQLEASVNELLRIYFSFQLTRYNVQCLLCRVGNCLWKHIFCWIFCYSFLKQSGWLPQHPTELLKVLQNTELARHSRWLDVWTFFHSISHLLWPLTDMAEWNFIS